MYKHPLDYKKEDLNEIMYKKIKVHIGPRNSDKIEYSTEGEIIKCSLAANPPHLPGTIELRLNSGKVEKYDFFQIKGFSDIE